jgi:hypothetical protein
MIRTCVLIACLAVTTAGGRAQTSANVPVMTRLVKVYLDAEMKLARAMDARDKATIESVLADAFELREAAAVGRPVPRGDCLARAMATPAGERQIGQMAVHDHGATRVVSFELAEAGARRMIVDVWSDEASGPKLLTRYEAAISSR